MMSSLTVVAVLALATQGAALDTAALHVDDECTSGGDGSCSLAALQLRAGPAAEGDFDEALEAAWEGGELGAGAGSPVGLPLPEGVMAPSMRKKLLFALARGDRMHIADTVIDHFYASVNGEGAFMERALHVDETWRQCTSFDYSNWSIMLQHAIQDWRRKDPDHVVIGNVGIVDIMSKFTPLARLGVAEACRQDGWATHDPSCYAVRAAIFSTSVLKTLIPEGPKFANYSVVDWGEYPSWQAGAVADINTSAKPPSAKLLDPLGVIPYYHCDLARTVLTQSPNQMTRGTCSFTATLAALARRAPAYTVKLADRLFWTGRISRKAPEICEYIYQQQPGLVPFKLEGKIYPAGFTGDVVAPCEADPASCSQSEGPYQAPGLQTMWTQTLIDSWIRNSWGGCEHEGQPKSYITYPGMSEKEFNQSSGVQGGGLDSMLWVCQMVIDPLGGSCKALFNHNICLISDDDCYKMQTYPLQSDLAMAYFEAPDKSERNRLTKKFPVLAQYEKELDDISYRNQVAIELDWVPGGMLPSFTEELLEETCAQHVALLVIAADALITAIQDKETWAELKGGRKPFYGTQGRPPFGACDHAVFLENCNYEANEYTIWTWGRLVTVHREALLGVSVERDVPARANGTFNSGIICGAVTARQITLD